MATRTMNFTIGEDFGTLITGIAREHLLYSNNLPKAIRTISDSLIGITDKQAFGVLVGTKKLDVDVENQEMIFYSPTNVEDIFQSNLNKLKKYERDFSLFSGVLVVEATKAKNKLIKININGLTEYFKDEDDRAILDQIDDKYYEYRFVISIAMRTIGEYFRLFNTMQKTLDMADSLGIPLSYSNDDIRVCDSVMELQNQLNRPGKSITKEQNKLDNYFDTIEKIEVDYKGGISPVDIREGFNAGWLSPDGDYYGMNGEYANMLHIAIADALVLEGVIPEDFGGEVNADVWLERNGWVKQHNDWILYSGYDNSKLGLEDVPITKEQIDSLYRMGQHCYQGRLAFGYGKLPISAVMLPNIDPLQFKLKWFKL